MGEEVEEQIDAAEEKSGKTPPEEDLETFGISEIDSMSATS